MIRAIRIIVTLVIFAPPCLMAAEDLTHITGAGGTVYFAWDGESGSYAADVGLGSFGAKGGYGDIYRDIAADCTNGTIDTATYHYSGLSTDAAGQSAVAGSTHSFKTPYDGDCNNESFSRDNSTILIPAAPSGYLRFYHKFTGNWMNGSVQHKFIKIYNGGSTGPGSSDSPVMQMSFAANSNVPHILVPNVDGHFDKDGITRAANVWVTASDVGGYYSGVNRSYDDDIATEDYNFAAGQYSAIEVYWKMNTSSDVADAEMDVWVDGVKIVSVSDFRFYAAGDRPAATIIEMQHVYYTRATSDDQPTYMDNIVVADRYIGPVGGATCSSPNGIQDNDETGIDCGGSCPACSTPPSYGGWRVNVGNKRVTLGSVPVTVQ